MSADGIVSSIKQPAPGPASRVTSSAPFLGNVRRNPMLVVSSIAILLLVLVASFADHLAPYDPTAIHMAGQLVDGKVLRPPYPPSAEYWLGTDQLGRDIFSRILSGIRTSLFIGVIVRGGVMIVGIILALLAGQWVGLLRGGILRFTEIMLAFPPLLIAMALTAALGPSLFTVTVALILVGWPDVVRLIYGQVLVTREMDFIEAARSIGATDFRILQRHILPNLREILIVAFSIGIPGAVMYEAGLSFFGFGIQPPTPSLGSIISDGRGYIAVAPWYPLFPGLALVLMVLAFNFFGEGLQNYNKGPNKLTE